jgi:hypothetical protein
LIPFDHISFYNCLNLYRLNLATKREWKIELAKAFSKTDRDVKAFLKDANQIQLARSIFVQTKIEQARKEAESLLLDDAFQIICLEGKTSKNYIMCVVV